uniref:Proteasome subunit beta n=1 Tax=Sarcoptes scabiei TaxID=52283 RepID=A0A834R3G2_SARSC
MTYNGGLVIAMKGKDCVAIAADRRLGAQYQTVSTNFQKIFEINPYLYIGLPGLATDTATVSKRLKFRVNLYELRENRLIRPKAFGSMVSNLLYERRFGPYFVEPIIAGIDHKTGEPFIAGARRFCVAGTSTEQSFGVCETLWRPDLGPEELFEVISQSLMSAFDRDAGAGWGGIVYIIEKDKVTVKTLKTRMD